jgi:hypothetical protein
MHLLEGDEEAAVGKLLQRLGIAGALDREGPAIAIEDRVDLGVGNAAEAPGLVALKARHQPLPEIGDGDQPSPAFIDHEARIAAEPGMAARKLEAGNEVELADAGDLGIAGVEIDGADGEAKRLGRRRERQEQREKESAAKAQGDAPARWRRTLAASRRMERSSMPSSSR